MERKQIGTTTSGWKLTTMHDSSLPKACCGLLIALSLIGTAAAIEFDDIQVEPDIVFGHKDGLALTYDVFRPKTETNRAAVVFMVSGGWYSSWEPPSESFGLFEPYLNEGYTVIAVRHGSSPRYSIPEAVADVRQGVRHIRQNAERLQIDPNRLGVLGMSAGGHLALMLGTTGENGIDGAKSLNRVSSRVAAVAALVPPTDLRVAVWESPESLPSYRSFPALNLSLDLAEQNSPLVHVTPDDAPALVIMGEKDELVPPRHGRWIADAFDKHQVTHKLLILEGADHGLGGPGNREKAISETVRWFNQHLVDPNTDANSDAQP